MAFTLNQIIELLDSYATAHKQINTFQFGDPWEFAESGDVVYPAMFAVNGTANVEGKELFMNFTLIFADRIDTDSPSDVNTQETEVLSDMLDVAQDILALLKDPANRDNFNLVGNAVLTPFTERFKDLTAGYAMDIRIKKPMLYNRCQVPNG